MHDEARGSGGITRRAVLAGAGAGVVALGLGGAGRAQAQPTTAPAAGGTGRGFRFVHLTDIHIMKDRRSADGLAAALKAVHGLDPRPDFILTGGDLAHDTRYPDLPEAEARIDLFCKVWKDHTDLPTWHCMGNHDAAGLNRARYDKADPTRGKKLVMDKVGLRQATYSFDHGGWHIVVMDNVVHAEPDTYQGEFPRDTLAWLFSDLLAAGGRPTVICTHIPPVSVLPFADPRNKGDGAYRIPYNLVTVNPVDCLLGLVGKNVKLILSGHLHQVERIVIMDFTLVCGGAVCGGWWTGDRRFAAEGFGVVDCRPDGTWDYRYHAYGWKAG